MIFQPYPTRSGLIFLGIAVFFGALAIFLARLLSQQSDWPVIFKLLVSLLLALAVMGLALYGTMIVFKLHYRLNRNGLVIQWGLARQIIPFENIKKLIPGKALPPPKFRGLNIAGLRLGWGELAEYGPLKFYTTARLAGSLLVVTPDQAYLISPDQPDNFIEAWQIRRRLGPTQDWSIEVRRSWPLNIPLLADPLTWWLWGLAALACFALFGYISLKLPELPPSLPIHFNTLGHSDRIADKSMLLMLPAAGAIGLVFNAVLGCLIYRRERVGAYLLWGVAIALQICLWVAMLTITAPGG
jgi:hypothetical protein